MNTDDFLEKMYFNKVKNFFTEEVLVQVFKRTDNKHDLSIRLKIDLDNSVFRYVFNCQSDKDIDLIVKALKSDLSIIGTEKADIYWRCEQFTNAIFHKTSNVVNYDLTRLGSLPSLAFSFGDEVISFNDF